MFFHCLPNVFYTFTLCLHCDSGFTKGAAIFLTTQHNTTQHIQGHSWSKRQ